MVTRSDMTTGRFFYLRRIPIISSSLGNRPVLCLEKIGCPSTTMSKTPLLPLINSGWTLNSLEILAARLVAWGR